MKSRWNSYDVAQEQEHRPSVCQILRLVPGLSCIVPHSLVLPDSFHGLQALPASKTKSDQEEIRK